MAYSKVILNGETLMDVTEDTVDSENLLSGETATKNSGAKVTGSLSPVTDVTVNGTSVVTSGVAAVMVPDVSGKIDTAGTGLSKSSTTLNHSNSVTAQTTQALYPVKIDAQGHISAYGSAVTVPTVTDTYSGTSSNAMSGKAVKSAIDALDGTVTGTAGSGKTLTAFSQTDGKVSATFGNISITKSQVSDFPTIPTKVSDLTNDTGYITGYTETDPTVPSWAKASAKPSYTASEVGAVPTTRTVNGKTLSSDITLSASDVSALPSSTTIPTITDTYSGTSSNGMSGKAVKSAIDALDGTVSGTAGSGKTLTAFSQTDGKVSATFGNISITKSQVSDFPTIPTVNNATLTIQKNGTNVNTFTANASSNVTANITVPTKTSDLSNDSGFITGVTSTSTPTASTIAEFDSSAHMNSTDMSSQEVDDFVDGLNVSGGGFSLYDFFSREVYSLNHAIASGGNAQSTLDVSKVGYYPLGIVGYDIAGTGSTWLFPFKLSLTNVTSGSATIYANLRNTASSGTSSGTINIVVLWVKI